jgi:ATP-dependent exoDNAse (exonuclease V) alpha subunit
MVDPLPSSPGIQHNAGSDASGDLLKFIEEDKDEDFNTLKEAAIGSLVQFNHGNDYMAVGAPNGCSGYITGAQQSTRGKDILEVTTEYGTVVQVKRTVEKKFVFNNGVRYVEFTKKAFPLQLAYAITAHKSQGCNVPGNVIIMVREAFAPGMLYVMLSRVTEKAKLFIVGLLPPSKFTPVPSWARGDGVQHAQAAEP